LPPFRVELEDWCEWTGNHWDKIRHVVGRSFRMRGAQHNMYTMAANAVLRLIDNYGVDPRRVRFLGLGTESSTDNSAGAVIVKGMVDDALRQQGKPVLARQCEVPEFKHACLGGVYGMKAALRYLACDGAGSQAIVVSADIAEYARGSSGEPTQGAGAVAMLLEEDPTLLEVDLAGSGSASDYRGVDFRKPMTRFCRQRPRANGQIQDLPVFNGKYSTTCYVDETLHALEDMLSKRELEAGMYFRDVTAVFMHRPYRRMPETGWAFGYLYALARGNAKDRAELAEYCATAGVELDPVLQEMGASPNVAALVAHERLSDEAYPLGMGVLKAFRGSEAYKRVVDAKMELGSDAMMDLGNLYTAALPAWMAAGLDEALEKGIELEGAEIMTLGYGSGDAADATPMRVCAGWREAAARIRFADALEPVVSLTQHQYESLHDHGDVEGLSYEAKGEFVVDHVGERQEKHFEDTGIEYYRFVRDRASSGPAPTARPQMDKTA